MTPDPHLIQPRHRHPRRRPSPAFAFHPYTALAPFLGNPYVTAASCCSASSSAPAQPNCSLSCRRVVVRRARRDQPPNRTSFIHRTRNNVKPPSHSYKNSNRNSNNNNNNSNNNNNNFHSHVAAISQLPNLSSSLASEHDPHPFRILFLISDTGGGHRASAQALAAAFDQLYPGRIESRIVDFWTEIVGRPFEHFPEGYSFLAKNPPLWRAAWNYGRFPLTRRLTEEFANAVGHRNFRDELLSFQPSLIVSVHPLTQFIPLRVLKSLPSHIPRPPFVTVCTDLGGAHPTWFHRHVDLCFVPTDRVRSIALRCGLKASQLRLIGLPVRPAFWNHSISKAVIRQQLGLADMPSPVVLIVGGGDGVGGVGRIASSIVERMACLPSHDRETDSVIKPTIVVVCGKNERLRTQLQQRDWPDSVDVVVNGFVNNMSEWMAAADLIVSKAGPGTIAEALIRGLPIVLSGFLPGQEAPNVQYVTQTGVGAFSRAPSAIADIVYDWVSHPAQLAHRAERAKALGRPNATYDIVREVAKLTSLENLRTSPHDLGPQDDDGVEEEDEEDDAVDVSRIFM